MILDCLTTPGGVWLELISFRGLHHRAGSRLGSLWLTWLHSLVNIWSVDKSCSYLIYIFRSNRYLQNPDERYLLTPGRKACVHAFILLLQSINKYIPETKKLCFFFLVSKPTLSLFCKTQEFKGSELYLSSYFYLVQLS